MVPKLPAKNNGKGASFRGAHQYYGHDKGAETSERVEWTATRNLATDNPSVAWRVMAATALDRDRLKAKAGIKNTGRKSDLVVLHFSLSWHPEQKGKITREEMEAACDEAMSAIGASEHQASLYAHNDEPQPHVHLVINRVSMKDGRLLSDSKIKLKLSQWAEQYEREHGKIYCEERVVNNELRKQGQFVRGEKDIPRHIFESLEKLTTNDNQAVAKLARQQRAKDHALSLRGRNMAKQHMAAWQALEQAHKDRKASLKRSLLRDREKARTDALKTYKQKLIELKRSQSRERETFEALESSLFGRASNIVRTARASTHNVIDADKGLIKRSFAILTNAGKRQAYFDKAQQRARDALKREQVETVSKAYAGLQNRYKEGLARARAVFEQQREALSKRQTADREQLKHSWAERTAERRSAIQAASAKAASAKAALEKDFNSAHGKDEPDYLSLYRSSFEQASRDKAIEQDNELDLGDDD